MITFQKLSLVKAMSTHLSIFQIIPLSRNYYNLITIDLSKQQKINIDLKAVQQIDFTGNLEKYNETLFFIIEEAKKTKLNFSNRILKVW